MDIPIDVQIVLGNQPHAGIGYDGPGRGSNNCARSTNRRTVEIMVNGRCIARGEITVLENDETRFGVKLIEVLSTKKT